MNQIELCHSPALYPFYENRDAIVVVVDVLRATSSICAAFANNVKALIPVETEDEAKAKKEEGYIVAAERNGLVLDFADFGNSPDNFSEDIIGGKEVVYSTTNGTKTIKLASDSYKVAIGAFINLSHLTEWITKQDKDVLILCAGWKNKVNMEDTIFGGALAERLIEAGTHETICDSVYAAMDSWKHHKDDLLSYINKAAQKQRLRKNGLDGCIEFCCKLDQTPVVPVYEGGKLVDAIRKEEVING